MAFYSQIRFMLAVTFIIIIGAFAVNTVYPIQLNKSQIQPREKAVSIDTEIFEQLQEFQKVTLKLLYQSYAGYFVSAIQSGNFEKTVYFEDWLVSFAKFIDISEKRNIINDEFSAQFQVAIRDLKTTFSTEVGVILDYLYTVETSIEEINTNNIKIDSLLNSLLTYTNGNSSLVENWSISVFTYANNIRSSNSTEADRATNASLSIHNLWANYETLITETLSSLASLNSKTYQELDVTTTVFEFSTKQTQIFNTYDLYKDQLLNSTEINILDPIFGGIKNTSTSYINQIKNYMINNLNKNLDITRITSSKTAGIPGSLGQIANQLEQLANKLNQDVSKKRAEVNTLNQRVSQQVLTVNLITSILVALMIILSGVKIIPPLTLLRSKANLLSKGDLTLELFNPKGSDELSEVQRAFDTMVISMKKVIQQGQLTAEKVAGISEELAAAAEEASSSVQEVSATVSEISYGASEQTEMVNKVSEQLKNLLDQVNKTVEQINEAADFVKKVSKRTNILGLNASIEAAKAGIYGRGFGIVAQSVRELAEDTKDRADEIAELIQNINITLKRTMEDVAEAVDKVRIVAEQTAAGSEEANAASEEQTAMMEEISSTSAELANLAQELLNVLSQFKT